MSTSASAIMIFAIVTCDSAFKGTASNHVYTPLLMPRPQSRQLSVVADSKAGHTDAKTSAPAMAMKTFSLNHKPRQSPTAVASSKAGMVESRNVDCLVWVVPCMVSSCDSCMT